MIQKIKEHTIFDNVGTKTVNKIIAAASPVKIYSKNEILFEPEVDEKDVFFILSGTVRLTLFSNDGDVVSYNDVQEKDFFGWLSILDNKERLTSAITQKESHIIQINGNILKEALFTDSQLMENFMLRIASVIRGYTKRIEELSALSVKQRVLNELLRRNKDNIVEIGTHEDFASWLGASRETVTRALRNLESEGVLKRSGNKYQILNSNMN